MSRPRMRFFLAKEAFEAFGLDFGEAPIGYVGSCVRVIVKEGAPTQRYGAVAAVVPTGGRELDAARWRVEFLEENSTEIDHVIVKDLALGLKLAEDYLDKQSMLFEQVDWKALGKDKK